MNRTVKASLLLFLLTLCGSSFFIAHKLRTRTSPPAPRDLFAVVNQQLIAFRASDFQGAYHYAAAGVQKKFTLSEFEKMVRRNYPEMARAERVEFGFVEARAGGAVVQALFFDADGSARSFVYSLVSEDGRWRIAGVEEIARHRSNQRLAGTHV